MERIADGYSINNYFQFLSFTYDKIVRSTRQIDSYRQLRSWKVIRSYAICLE